MVLSPAQIAERSNKPCHICGKVQEKLIGRQMNGARLFLCAECWNATEEDRKRRRKYPSSLRQTILERDGHKCLKCGSKWRLSVDHIVSIANGGTSEASNLQTLCRCCNTTKRSFDNHLREFKVR